jgi:hypothetical protein
VHRHHTWPARDVRNREIGAVKHFCSSAHHLSFKPPQPPATLGGRAGTLAFMKICGHRSRHRERLIRQQPILVLRVLRRQCPRQFPGIARDAAGGNGQRGGIEGGYHKGYKESVGYLTWAMRI